MPDGMTTPENYFPEAPGRGPGGILPRKDRMKFDSPTDPSTEQQEIPDWVKAMGLEYGPQGRNYFEPAVVEQFIEGVRNLSSLKARLVLNEGKNQIQEYKKIEKEVEKEREKMKSLREEIFYDQLGLVDGLHEEMLGFLSPFPYESRPGANFIGMFEEKLNKELTLKRKEKLEEESVLLLKEMRESTLWIKGQYHILEGLGSAMQSYYDAEREQDSLFTMYKRITGGDWKKAFTKELRGAALSIEEKEKLTKFGYLDKDKKETLRDEAIRYSDDQMFWTIALASAGQWDHFIDNQSDRVMDLSEKEIEIIHKLFGVMEKEESPGVVVPMTPLECTSEDFYTIDGKKVPKTVFSWFAISTASDDRLNTMETMMQVVLENDIKGRMDRGENIDALVEEVKSEARKRLDVVDAPKNMREKLSFAVFNQNLIMINGLMASGDIGWRFDYSVRSLKSVFDDKFKDMDKEKREKAEGNFRRLNASSIRKAMIVNEKGQREEVDALVERKLDLGSIYTAFDVSTVYFWMLHKIIYDGRAEDRSTLMPPSVGEFRKMFDGMPPDFKLDIYKYCSKVGDVRMLGMLDLLESDLDDAFGDGKSMRKTPLRQSGEKFGVPNIEFMKFLKENISAFMMPFYDEKVIGSDGKEKPKWLVLPVPIPPVMDALNFFRAIRSTKGADTFYEQLLSKSKKMSTLDWGKITRHAFDGWRVTSNQAHRWSVFLIGTHELDKDKEMAYKTWFEKVRGIVFKQIGKRGRLGSRMDEELQGVWNLAIEPFMIALSSAKETGLLGRNMLSRGEGDIASEISNYKRRISDWVNVALDMPSDAYGLENYNGTAAFMIYWYGSLLERVSEAALKNYGNNQADVRGNISNILMKKTLNLRRK